MRIVYIANARIPTEKAHGLQIMQMCRAFAQNGHEVFLVVPAFVNVIDKTPWEYYGLEPTFKVVKVPVFDFIPFDKRLGNLALWLTTAWFGLRARRIVEELEPDVIYSRDPSASAWTPRWIPHVFEAHTFPNRALWLYRRLWDRADRIVSVTDGLKRMFIEHGGVLPSRLRVAADAVDPEAFDLKETKEECRRRLGLPEGKFLAVYSGHLFPYKGVPDLIEAAAKLRDDIRVVLVGGRPHEVERVREMVRAKKLDNVILTGHVPHAEVPRYLRAADLAVMPYTQENLHVRQYASPLKLFEYLAAGRAVVTTDIPSVREVLDERTAEFVPPGDPQALSAAVNRLAGDPARLGELEAQSRRLAAKYTWKQRAAAVLDAMPRPRVEWKLTFWKKYRLEIQVALLAFAIRAVYVIFFPQRTIEGGDAKLYLALADHLRGARGTEGLPQFYAPAYPALLAAVRAVFGEALVWVRLFQSALSAGTVFLITLIARRVSSPYAAWIAGLLSALYVPMILESSILYTETTYAFFLTLSVWLLLRAIDARRLTASLAVGLSLTVATLTRDIALYLTPLLAAAAGAFKRSWKAALAILLPTLLAGGLFAARNIALSPGKNFVEVPTIGKRFDRTFFEPDFREAAFSPERLYLYPVGVWRYFRFPFRLLEVSGSVSMKRALFERDGAAIRANWPELAVKTFLVLFHWFVLVMAAIGVFKGRVTRVFKTIALIVIFYAMLTILLRTVGHHRIFEVYEPLARYRFPTEPLILVLAAVGIARLTEPKQPSVNSRQPLAVEGAPRV